VGDGPRILLPARAGRRDRVVRDLGNARLLTFRGDGHGVLKQFEPCPVAYFVAYVEDLELPPAGASCTQAPGPWSADLLASRRGRAVERR